MRTAQHLATAAAATRAARQAVVAFLTHLRDGRWLIDIANALS